MVYLLYDLILFVASLFLVPYAFIKGLPYGNSLKGVCQRLGFYSGFDLQALCGKQVFWVHAASVGEVRASFPLIKALKDKFPESRIVLSGMTFTGQQVACEAADVDLVVFSPFDLSLVVKRSFRLIQPDVVIIIETEIWPNFIRIAEENSIPLVLANGRISKKSFPRYLSIKSLVKPLLEKISAFAMQDATCARRIKALGAPPELVQVTGNMKFDLPVSMPGTVAILDDQVKKKLLAGKFVWVAGSIRSGEAEILLQCHKQLISRGIPSFPIFAPRHPGCCISVAELLKKEDIPFALRSSLGKEKKGGEEVQILLVDTVGELTKFYALADVIFVGGSLVPVGGHNLLEPAQQGKPVLFGSHISNFKEISRLLLACGGGIKVGSGDELVSCLVELYRNEQLCDQMGQAGLTLIRENVGATEKTLSSICRILESKK